MTSRPLRDVSRPLSDVQAKQPPQMQANPMAMLAMLGQFERVNRRNDSLASPLVFRTTIGATSTTIYTGQTDRYFMIRKLVIGNTTGGAINLGITVGGTDLVTSYSVAANTTISLTNIVGDDTFAGFLMDVSEDLAATGQNLEVMGWGIQVFGAEALFGL